MTTRPTVQLRSECDKPDSRFLWAYLDNQGQLLIDGQDLGPGTAIVSGDGEYEWYQAIAQRELSRLWTILEIDPEGDVLDQLEVRYSGPMSYELERRIRESGVPVERQIWSG